MPKPKGYHTERDVPPYAKGTFEPNKVKQMGEYILGREGWVVEVEGGKRGGKDVTAIYFWSQFLMNTPDKEHLVLGRTLEHAIVTVLKSQGFGLYYCIPSGEFTRESISGGATRGVFKFTDMLGVEKIVYFYGNEKAQDYAKFKGFSLGSVYINEGNEQHTTGIREARERTNASLRPRIIITQNPKGASHQFYTEFEKPLIYGQEENFLIKTIKNRFEDAFLEEKATILKEMEQKRKQLVKDFLQHRRVPKAELLPTKEYNKLLVKVRTLKEEYNKKVRSILVKDITDEYTNTGDAVSDKISNASMQLVINYNPYFPNKNEIRNGLEFAYFHFTHHDNPAMSDADRSRVDRAYDTDSPTYKRDILGLRATVDNAIWPTFGDKNIIDYDIPKNMIMYRVFGSDLGYDHPFATVEALILDDYTVVIYDELFIVPAKEREKANNVEYIKALRNFINGKFNGDYIGIRVDPSAKGFINQANSGGLIALKAKNRVRNYKPTDNIESDHSEDRKIAGINLVREGFRLKKILVHRRCEMTIKQIQGYAFDSKKLELGVETPIKINDDLPDALRYVINSEVGYVSRWEGGDQIDVEKRKEEVLGEQVSKDSKEEDEFTRKQKANKARERLTKSLIDSFGNNSRFLF